MASDDERGFCKKCFINCAACCCLFPMAWISFLVFDLSSAVSGGLFTNIGPALDTLITQNLPQGGQFVSMLAGGFIGMLLILVFPIHWLLYYRPDEPEFAIAMMIPWILVTFISAIIWARDMKEGFMFGIKISVIWMVFGIIIYLLLSQVLGAEVPAINALLNGLSQGLTDLSPILAIFLACLEGGIIGGVFGALAGAIRYKPGEKYKPKTSGYSGETDAFGKPTMQQNVSQQQLNQQGYAAYQSGYQQPQGTYQQKPQGGYQSPADNAGTAQKSGFCTNCGKKMNPNEDFCTNCGTRR